jgi:MFS family permease
VSSSLAEPTPIETPGDDARGFDPGAISIIGVAALAMAATLPGRTHGLGLITQPLMSDFRLTATDWAHINLVATLVGALFCFPAGWLIDRCGAAIVLFGTLVALGAVTYSLGRTTDTTALLILVTLTRGFGQSALSVVSIALVGRSFDRRLTWPMATYSVLMTIFFVVVYQTIGHFIKQPDSSWQDTWVWLGAALVVAGPIGWLTLAATNLPARTAAAAKAAAADKGADGISGFTLVKAIRTPAFWIFALCTSLFGLAAAGMSLYNVPLLIERRLTLDDYLKMQAFAMPLGLLGQACCGFVAKRVSYQRIVAVAMVIYALGLAAMTRVASAAELNACGAVVGFSGGIITVIFFAIWARLFGMRELGRIQGVAQMSTVLASAIGPELFAAAKVHYDSYIPAVYWLVPVIGLFGAAAWFTRSPNPPAVDKSALAVDPS